jgi:hypothetical protein
MLGYFSPATNTIKSFSAEGRPKTKRPLTEEDFGMRSAIAATAAVLTLGVAAAFTASPAAAQKKKAVAQLSVNECIDLARKRGYTDSDLTVGGGNPARTFVLRCLQGKQR